VPIATPVHLRHRGPTTYKYSDVTVKYALSDDYILCRICESASIMPKTLAPEVRSQFAKRLKAMRVQAGFPRARYFAKSLGIEENRYTRYERAEVEPSLTLIHKICEVLRISPNELLGFDDFRPLNGPGFAEDGAGDLAARENHPERHAEQLAWRLASEVVAMRYAHRAGPKGGPDDPLAATRETARLFHLLLKDPFNTIADIVGDEALKAGAPEHKAEIAQLVAAYTGSNARR
jgi:transcriptional regulator with XRE-family HTH domain